MRASQGDAHAGDFDATSPTMAMSPEMSGAAMMSMQPGADAVKVTIASPSSGTMVTVAYLCKYHRAAGMQGFLVPAGG